MKQLNLAAAWAVFWCVAIYFLPVPVSGQQPQLNVTPVKTSGKLVVNARTGKLITIQSVAKGDIEWRYDTSRLPDDQVLKIPTEKKLVLTTAVPGTYSIVLIEWDEKKLHDIILIVTAGPLPPPGPDPDPIPDPIPVPIPDPVDPWFPTLKAAYTSDTDVAKKLKVDFLAGVFKAAVNDVKQGEKAIDLQIRMHAAADSLIGTGALAKTRRALADELNKRVPLTQATVIDASIAAALQAQFQRFAALLGALK